MKKILVVFDGAHFPSATLDFVLELNSSEPIKLVGVFLPSVDYAEVVSYAYYGKAVAPVFMDAYEEDEAAIKENVALFEAFCKDHHIHYKVHQNIRKSVVKELRDETRYADLLILSSIHFYENLGEVIQEEYLDDTLHKAECPVVLLHGTYTRPDNIILAYDGSAASMHAIKQFVYLLPQWGNLNTLIVYMNDSDDEIPFFSLLKEYAAQHFSSLGYYKLDADPKKYFATWMENKGATMMVSGAYGRSAFSEIFRRNFLKDVVKDHQVPLFIAHL